jgi:hypothetical protein
MFGGMGGLGGMFGMGGRGGMGGMGGGMGGMPMGGMPMGGMGGRGGPSVFSFGGAGEDDEELPDMFAGRGGRRRTHPGHGHSAQPEAEVVKRKLPVSLEELFSGFQKKLKVGLPLIFFSLLSLVLFLHVLFLYVVVLCCADCVRSRSKSKMLPGRSRRRRTSLLSTASPDGRLARRSRSLG